MNVALRPHRMTRDQFFDWAQQQDTRYEFDGFQPVAMTGGSVGHSRIIFNLHAALRARLRGSGRTPLGDAGLATIGDAVRYPDALITCAQVRDDAYVVPGVVIVFEVISKTSGQMDRITKVREYHAIESIRRYVIVERTSIGMTMFERAHAAQSWTASTLVAGEVLRIPEVSIELPLNELYEGTELAAPGN